MNCIKEKIRKHWEYKFKLNFKLLVDEYITLLSNDLIFIIGGFVSIHRIRSQKYEHRLRKYFKYTDKQFELLFKKEKQNEQKRRFSIH
ncbi:MAG: hypothetical protein ACTSVV_03590 [Promethearchaeota archaeon]